MVYKVVRERNGFYKSYMKSAYELIYQVGRRTFPIVGKIFAFDTYDAAKAFYNRENQYRSEAVGSIWYADASVSAFSLNNSSTPDLIPSICQVSLSDIDLLFRNQLDIRGRGFTVLDVPKGTVFCDWIMLESQVHP